MNNKTNKTIGIGVALLSAVVGASGQVLFSDNFDSGVSDAANWNVNLGAGNNAATFGFDYSTLGIPAAPGSTTTIGLKLEANYATGAALATGVSASPVGQSFTGPYTVSFEFWSNFVGPGAATGNGTTQLTGAGVRTSGTVSQTVGVGTSSIWFAQTGDGGNSAAAKDYRIYSSANPGVVAGANGTGYAVTSGVYAAGTGTTAADNLNAQYLTLGANTEPAGEATLSAQQNGTTPVGAPAFRWQPGQITDDGTTITYSISGVTVATVAATGLTTDGKDIELIQSDINAGASSDPTVRQFEFGLFDNVSVTAGIVPEPSTYALGLASVVGFFMMRRRSK